MRQRWTSLASTSLRAALVTVALATVACDFSSTGDFDGVVFSPGATVFGVHDRHEFLVAAGETTAVRKPESELAVTLVFTNAQLDPTQDWRRYRASTLLEKKKDLAVRDGLLLEGIPLASIVAGEDIELVFDGNVGSGIGPLSTLRASIVSALPPASIVSDQGLGDHVTLQITFDVVDVRPSAGEIRGQIDFKRERGPDQEGEIATGQVTLQFAAPLQNERLGKANLDQLLPVMRCAATRGPSRAGGCRDAAPLPTLDETSTLLVR